MEPTNDFSLGVDLAQESFVASLCVGAGEPQSWRAQPALAVALPPDDPAGIEALLDWLATEQPGARCARVIVESTGQLSWRFARAVAGRGLPQVAIVNPYRTKACRVSLGVRDKSDQVDARLLALYAAAHRPKTPPPRSAVEERLREMSRLRERYVQDLDRWKNRQRETLDKESGREIAKTIRHLEKAIRNVERAQGNAVKEDAVLSRQVDALTKIRGIKRVTAMTLTAELGDLSHYGRSQLSAAAGLFPKVFDSGKSVHRKPRLAKGGGGRLRRVLYMCATSLFRSKGALRAHIDRLQRRGMSDMTIEGAVMRKLLLIARAVVRNGGIYDETKISRQGV